MIVTEYLAGGSLWDLLHDPHARYSWAEAVELALGAGRGINHLHACQPPIVHRDLKSANLLVSVGGGGGGGGGGGPYRCVVRKPILGCDALPFAWRC